MRTISRIAESKAQSSRSGYRADIDGLRALAVLAVILFHANLGLSGGYVGVDIFLVISGFLICSLVLGEINDNAFRLTTFWERRIRRILPILTVVVLATIAASWFLYLPGDFEGVGKSAVAQALLRSNFFFAHQSGYFAATAETKPLLHTWSLAVEEQFYLLFPLLMILTARYKKLSLPNTIALLAIASLILCIIGSFSHPWGTFYLLPTRAWELLTGAFLAASRGRIGASKLVRGMSGWLGLGFVGYAVYFYHAGILFPGVAAMLPCVGAALIIFSSEIELSPVGRLLAFKPMVFVGLISYSLYLWHWPLLVFSRYSARQERSVEFRCALLVACAGLAVLSWKFVETPFRNKSILPKRYQIFGFAGASMATLLALGLAVSHSHGFPSRLSESARRFAGARNDPGFNSAFMVNVNLKRAVAGQFVEFGSHNTNNPTDILIWGDSHARVLTTVLDDLCRNSDHRGIMAVHSATAPLLEYTSTGPTSLKGDSPVFSRAVFTFIGQRHVKTVILAARWNYYPTTQHFKSSLLMTARSIMNSGARLYVLKDVPNQGFDVPRFAALTALHHGDVELLGVSREQHQLANSELSQTFDELGQMGATVLDPSEYLLNSRGVYGIIKNGRLLYADGDHLTVDGARLLTPLFEQILCSK